MKARLKMAENDCPIILLYLLQVNVTWLVLQTHDSKERCNGMKSTDKGGWFFLELTSFHSKWPAARSLNCEDDCNLADVSYAPTRKRTPQLTERVFRVTIVWNILIILRFACKENYF